MSTKQKQLNRFERKENQQANVHESFRSKSFINLKKKKNYMDKLDEKKNQSKKDNSNFKFFIKVIQR